MCIPSILEISVYGMCQSLYCFIVCLCHKIVVKTILSLSRTFSPMRITCYVVLVTDCILQEDLLTFVDVRTLKIKHEEQFKYEVKDILLA